MDKVCKDLPKSIAIAWNHPRPRPVLVNENLAAMPRGHGGEACRNFACKLKQVNRGASKRHLAGLKCGEIEHLIRHLHKVQHLNLNLRRSLLCATRIATITCRGNRFSKEADRTEWRAQFMRQVVYELRTNLAQTNDLCQVTEKNPGTAIAVWRCGDLHVSHLVGVSRAKITKRDLATGDRAVERLARELLKSMVNGRLNKRATAQIVNFACQDLLTGGARCADRKVGEDAQNGVVGRIKQCIKTLRATLGSRRFAIGTFAFTNGTRCAVDNLIATTPQPPCEEKCKGG
jgi:hypothetical protein